MRRAALNRHAAAGALDAPRHPGAEASRLRSSQRASRGLSILVFLVAFSSLEAGRSYSRSGDTLPAELLPLAILKNGGPDFTGIEADPGVSYGFIQSSPFRLGQMIGSGRFGHFHLAGLAGILVSPSRGLFVYSPILLLGVVGLFRLSQSGASEHAASLLWHAAFFVPALLVLCVWWPKWWGGHSFGYRLVSELIPVLLLPAALAWEAAQSPLRALALGLAVVSIGIHSLGTYAPSAFNSVPDNIDQHPERLWSVRDSDVARMIEGRR
ncbi:MAG: hypothetical protein ABIT01_12585 [Thermoanaerobaculia bacterium]